MTRTSLTKKELSNFTALRVKVDFARDSANPDFKGAWAGNLWWPVGEFTEAVLESDKGATGALQVDEETHQVLKLYTLEQKLNQLYILEGRRQDDYGIWSEPGFEIVTEQGGDFSSNSRPPKPGPRAAVLVRITILDRRDKSGAWASELAAAAAATNTKTPQSAAGKQ